MDNYNAEKLAGKQKYNKMKIMKKIRKAQKYKFEKGGNVLSTFSQKQEPNNIDNIIEENKTNKEINKPKNKYVKNEQKKKIKMIM